MTRFIQVVTTVNNKEEAEIIAGKLLEQRLAACVQISRCSSIYRWQGNLEHAEEFELVMKTSKDIFPLLQKVLEDIHPYDIPEILATEIIAGNSAYLAWLDGELATQTYAV
jgi:periplasmic divalent cation tolerance protein